MRLPVPRYASSSTRRGVCSAIITAMLASMIVVPLPAIADWPTLDEVEPNDTPAEANALPADGTIMNAEIDPAGDLDWFAITVSAGVTYQFETGPNTNELDVMTDTFLNLYQNDGITEIASDDDDGIGYFSLITYTPPADTTLRLRVRHYSQLRTGSYGVRAYQQPAGSTVTITGTVTDGTGPIADINVTDLYIDEWFTAFEDYWSVGTTSVSAADGSYSLTGPAGAHRVRFTDPARDYLGHHYQAEPVFRYADIVVLAHTETATGVDAVMIERQPLETDLLDMVRASVHTNGTEGDGPSLYGSTSADGRYVAFESRATNLVDGDTNGFSHIFVRDLVENTTRRVSVHTNGTEGNDGSSLPSIDGEGRYVAFHSWAANLVDDDTNGQADVFVHDLVENTTRRVSVHTDGTEGDANSYQPYICADGTRVGFYSYATVLVDDDTNGQEDVFVHDLETETTMRVSVRTDGSEGDGGSSAPTLSDDGRYVAFQSLATNLVDGDTNDRGDAFVHDLAEGVTERVSVRTDGTEGDSDSHYPAISGDGRYVAFGTASVLDPNDDNRTSDIHVHDRAWHTTRIVTSSPTGVISEADSVRPSISASGDYIVFHSGAADFVNNVQNATSDIYRAEMLVVLPPPSGISGMVSGQESVGAVTVPLENATVTVWSTGSSPMVKATATTAADGTYSAPLDPGDYLVHFDADGYAAEFFDDATEVAEATPVSVTAQSFTEDIDATLLATEFELAELWGDDRYATAIAVSQEAYPDGLSDGGSRTVVLARGERFPDALAGSALAGLVDGPILLTRTSRLLDEVAEEIERLGAVRVMLLGEELALSAEVEAAVEALDGVETVVRFGGASRYETADAIAEYVIAELGDGFGGAAFVATGARFPDSLAASPVIGAQRMPLFLVHPSAGLSESSVGVMTDGEVETATILGGPLAVSASVESALESLLGAANVERVEGGDRYETAALVAELGVSLGHTWDHAGVASGVRFPDSLTGGAYQAKSGSVMLLTRATTLNEHAETALSENADSIHEVRIYGGPLAIAQEVRDAIAAIFEAE